ncbi:Z-ring formation inhibitor MciZ [Peribacillus sp. SCS-155]|uniref:Z-ring formation inhibitor MciZ n=1 Tax=Peribacillus sedimenti TaxID=3115297 RepID=UPI0039069241
MKVYVLDNGFVMAGKAWEIRNKLRELKNKYGYVSEWINARPKPDSPQNLTRIK